MTQAELDAIRERWARCTPGKPDANGVRPMAASADEWRATHERADRDVAVLLAEIDGLRTLLREALGVLRALQPSTPPSSVTYDAQPVLASLRDRIAAALREEQG